MPSPWVRGPLPSVQVVFLNMFYMLLLKVMCPVREIRARLLLLECSCQVMC